MVKKGTSPSSWAATTVDVEVHLHVRISAVVDSAQVWITVGHVVWKECALVEVAPLVHAFLSGRVKLHHHG